MESRFYPLIFGTAIAFAYPFLQNDKQPETIEQKVEIAARKLNAGIANSPQDSGRNVITSATAAGETLIVKVKNVQDWRNDYTESQISEAMAQGLCEGPGVKDLLAAGARIKVKQTTDGDMPLPALEISSCP